MISSSSSRISGASAPAPPAATPRPAVQQLVDLLDDLGAEHRDGRPPIGGATAQVGHGLVEVGGHGAPALEEGIGLGGRADRLVGGDVEQIDLRPVHRVDVEGGEVGVEHRSVGAQCLGQGGARHRVRVVADLGQPSSNPSRARATRRSPRGSCPRAGRRSGGRRWRWRRSGCDRGRPPSSRRGGRGRSVRLRWSRRHASDRQGSLDDADELHRGHHPVEDGAIQVVVAAHLAGRAGHEVRTFLGRRTELDDVLVAVSSSR